VTLDKLIEVTQHANAFDFINKLPDKFDTMIGDRGITLSGGERQRIAIARALLSEPEILIFDEATSSLDTESEKIVQNAINNVLENKTAIIVAHRLSTILDADMILVLKDGEIAERGTHSELLASNGVYRKLYDIQFDDKK
jgi:subfamily B ATP-binding cassette protein MsbA